MAAALSASAFESLMAGLGPFGAAPTFAVAVSGGADSMALLLLTHQWTNAHGGKTVALSVDHGLRAESAGEAKTVGAWCRSKNIEHHILTWAPPEMDSAIQAEARGARYELLTNWCREHHVLHLLTAHHQDDQAETLFFRLARSSNTDGLSCMPAASQRYGVRLLRPLLPVSKAQLIATLAQFNQEWIEDPTNAKMDYTRNRIRNQMVVSGEHEALSKRAFILAESFGIIRNALETKTASHVTSAIDIFPEGYGTIHSDAFSRLENGYALRALSSLLLTVNGESYPLRTEKLERLYAELAGGTLTRRTIGGCLLSVAKKRILVTREPKATAGTLALTPQAQALWDKRFCVAASQNLTVRALGNDGLKSLKSLTGKIFPASPDKAVMAMLPSFWHLEELVAVPHINYKNPQFQAVECSARFRPAKALAGPAFFSMNTNKTTSQRECV